MRLINATALVNDGRRIIQDFLGSKIPTNAILSHCWSTEASDEISYTDFVGEVCNEDAKGYRKIWYCCLHAINNGIEWAWVDTCCIDKRSSAELSEALNSMYAWYERSQKCSVFLEDVDMSLYDIDTYVPPSLIEHCHWFSRGWTLQELIAPSQLEFFDKNMSFFGNKDSLLSVLTTVTCIPRVYLTKELPLREASVARRMSWASTRQTTRIEDEAYCLLGIFGLFMAPLYGEGNRAFIRLQEAIISKYNDDSIFAWVTTAACKEKSANWTDRTRTLVYQDTELYSWNKRPLRRGLLASSPKEFGATGDTAPNEAWRHRPPTVVNSHALKLHHAHATRIEALLRKLTPTIVSFLRDSDTLIYRLDCDCSPNASGSTFIGIRLRLDKVSQTWYRDDPSTLIEIPMSTTCAFSGFTEIYAARVQCPDRRPRGRFSSHDNVQPGATFIFSNHLFPRLWLSTRSLGCSCLDAISACLVEASS